MVRAFGTPGSSKRTDSFQVRAAAGDYTLLHDCISRCIVDLEALAGRLEREIDPEPTTAIPGSEEKIEVLRERFASGKRIFHDDDERNFH